MIYNKILVEIHHGLGDVVQMIPLISNLRKNFINAKISVIVSSDIHAEILNCTGLVDNYFILNLRNMKARDIFEFIIKIRKEKYDIGFLSPISNKKLGAILLYLLGCKCRVGEVSNGDKFLFRNSVVVNEDYRLHKIDRNLNLLRALNINIYDYNPYMKIDKKNELNAKNKLGSIKNKLIGICIGTNPVEQKIGFRRIPHEAKKWDFKNYIKLIELLIKDFDIVLLGGKKEKFEIIEYERELKNESNIKNYIGMTTIMESISLIDQCDLVIGGDTGMLHIADALGKNTLTVFGPTDPKLVGPRSENSNNVTLNIDCQYCYGTDRIFECTDRKCLNNITVEYIYNKAVEILN